MSSTHAPRSVQLPEGELLRCDDATRGVWLSVLRGRVWLTRANDPDDHFLDGGHSMWLSPGAQALASAEGGPADVVLLRSPITSTAPRAGAGSTMGGLQPCLESDP
jgi:hypothetical protein